MMRRRGLIGSILGGIGACFLGVKRSSANVGTLTPPPLAVSAGFSNLIFDEEFDLKPDIGFGTDGHKWNAGLWWEPVPSCNAFNVSDSILTITAGTSVLKQGPTDIRSHHNPRLWTNYYQHATEETARTFWSIMPPETPANAITHRHSS